MVLKWMLKPWAKARVLPSVMEGATLAQTDHHVDAGLGQVFGMGVALGAKADDGDGLAVQHAEVAVGIVILLDSHD